jgi:hypothetical protein
MQIHKVDADTQGVNTLMAPEAAGEGQGGEARGGVGCGDEGRLGEAVARLETQGVEGRTGPDQREEALETVTPHGRGPSQEA